jgi:dynactin-3
MASVDLSSLEERIRLLEDKVGLSGEPSKQSCVEMLVTINERLRQAKATREAMSQIWSQMGRLKSYLDPQLEAKATVTDTVKADIVIAGEQHIRQIADRLGALHTLKDNINATPLQSLPTFAGRLQPLVHVHIGQQVIYTCCLSSTLLREFSV